MNYKILAKLLAATVHVGRDSTAREVRAFAGVHVERPNLNIGSSILCSPKA